MDFFVTLPSNSKNIFKDNTTSEFTTLLAKTIKLEQGSKVGLSEIIFTSKWSVFMGLMHIYDLNEKTMEKIPIYIVDGSTFSELISGINNIIYRYYFDKELQERIKIKNNLPLKFTEEFKFAEGKYEKLMPPPQGSEVSQALFKEIDEKVKAPRIDIKYNKLSFNSFENKHFWFTDRLNEIFAGLKYNSTSADINVKKEEVNYVKTLYIYTDIIEYQFVGDKLAPLLRTVPVERQDSGTLNSNFTNPDYLLVNKNEIFKINIKICDDSGNNIRFIDGKVIVKLNFKKE